MKQIVKLIKLARQIPTSKDFVQFYKSADQDPLEEVEIHQRLQQKNDQEERAGLLLKTFFKKTSVIFDMQSLAEILMDKQDIFSELSPMDKEVLCWLLSKSLILMRSSQEKELQHYWKNATAFLTLEVSNEILQIFRVQDNMLEPIMDILVIVVTHQSQFPEELIKDICQTLIKILEKDCSYGTFS